MSRRFRKWQLVARRPLSVFLTLCMVLQMMPAQGVAYALDEVAGEPEAIVE